MDDNLDVLPSAPATRFCTNCNESETPDRKLKKCGGCSDPDVVYCSVICQKMAWVGHKPVCRSGSAVVLAGAPRLDDAWNGLDERSALCNDSLRRCHECDKPPTNGKQLKKCGACITLYCSSACQRKAWPTHKAICKPKDGAESSGDISNGSRITDFLTAQYYTFRGIAYSMALLHCQAQRELDPTSVELPHFLRFKLRELPSADTRGSGNPATRFMLVDHSFDDMKKSMRERPLFWQRAEPMRKEAIRMFSRDSTYGGPLAVEYYVPGSDVSGVVEWYPLARPLPTPLHDPATTTAVLNDLITFCVDSINLGFPLRFTKVGDPTPRPGRYVRSGKNWRFEELFSDWSRYRPGQHRNLDYALSRIKSGRSVSRLFYVLHAEQGIIAKDDDAEVLRRAGVSEAFIPFMRAMGAVPSRAGPVP